ncbi:MAG TPA: phosphoribosylglycinamide formyltransferase [Polyangiaceae bacterium]|nr:phosphoribosylglycinamide formyltransferase [Polyangiaceae bacterium]
MLSIGVLVSGTGTNLQAILDAVKDGTLPAKVAVVVSNKPGVLALERAEKAGVPTRVLSHKDYGNREGFDAALVETLRAASVDLVVLAGFMRLLTKTFLDAFPNRIVNIHPSLLPAFPGVDAQDQALAYGVKVAGCTVHFVDEGTDTGPIIGQRAVPVLDGDDAAALRARILAEEHSLLVSCLALIAEGRVEVVPGDGGRRARVRTRLG